MNIAKWIKDELEAAGKNGRYLAREVGVSEGAVSRWLSGHAKPTYDNLSKIAGALEIPKEEVAALFTES